MNEGRSIFAEFCDDIRLEVGNKYSLMGCYSSEVVLDTAPSLLPKLCCLISAVTPKEKPFAELAIRAYLGEELLAEQVIDAEYFKKNSEFFKDAPVNTTTMIARIQMAFVPLLINEACTLRIELTTEEGLMLGPKLRFTTTTTGIA